MRVLHVAASLSPEWGGTVPIIANLTHALQEKGVECAVFAAKGRRVGSDRVPLDGIETRLFDTDLLALLWTGHARRFARALRQAIRDYDLVHIHELWHYPGYVAFRSARTWKKPYIVTIHGELSTRSLEQKSFKKWVYMTAIQRRILQCAATLQVNTKAEACQIRALGFDRPVATIPNGISLEGFQDLPPRSAFFERFGDLSGKRIILFLGRIHPQKGLDVLAKAFGEIARVRDDVCLVVAGPNEGGYRSQVETILRPSGALSRTVFTGMLRGADKLAAYSVADIFVLPSYSEGFSMAILEALAAGIPVVISQECNFPEVVEAGAGLVVDPDPEQLRVALTNLLDRHDVKAQMGQRGQDLISHHYTWDSVAARLREVYVDILKQAGSQR